jgi:heme oxygenase (mycobilin-producing)
MSSPVVLINTFSVPHGMEEEFIQLWSKTAENLRQNASCFIDTKLHRSIDPNVKFQFVNIAHWESTEAWQSAMTTFEIYERKLPIEVNPALYNVAVQY